MAGQIVCDSCGHYHTKACRVRYTDRINTHECACQGFWKRSDGKPADTEQQYLGTVGHIGHRVAFAISLPEWF